MFRRVAAHDTLKSGLSVSAAGRPAPVVPPRPGRGAADGAHRTPRTLRAAEAPSAGNSGPRAHGPLLEPAPQQPPQTLTFVYCLSAFGVRPREGRGAGGPGPGRDSAPRTRAGRGEPALGLRGEGLRGCASPAPARRSLRPRRPLAFASESFVAGTSPRCAGRRRPRAAGGRVRRGVGLPAASPGSGPGGTRLPPPPRPATAARLGPLRSQDGGNFSLRLNSERGSLSLPCPSFPGPPFPSLSSLHHPQAKYCYFMAPNLVPFEYIIYFL